jgi:hypothetical protein
MNLIGAITALILICLGHRPKRYGWSYCFELKVNFGLELGIFFIAPVGGYESVKQHEHGHGIQNVYFGPFTIGMISIPSATRYWVREFLYWKGTPPKTKYDDIWFEGQASLSGKEFINNLK